jgi:hypothetical protein
MACVFMNEKSQLMLARARILAEVSTLFFYFSC